MCLDFYVHLLIFRSGYPWAMDFGAFDHALLFPSELSDAVHTVWLMHSFILMHNERKKGKKGKK